MRPNQIREITGKLLLTGQLKLESPLLIGTTAFDSGLDRLVIRDGEGWPYIPGTSLGGVLRHYYEKNANSLGNEEAKEWFWGSGEDRVNDGDEQRLIQSALIISDARISEDKRGQCRIAVRDGVKISSVRGVAENEKKYDYELVEPGAIFEFQAEVNLIKEYAAEFEKIAGWLFNMLTFGKIRIGALTTKGFGRCRLFESVCWKYDFQNKRDVWNWLAGIKETKLAIDLPDCHLEPEPNNDFILNAIFKLKTSLLIKGYAMNSDNVDAVHIRSGEQNIVPGTSIKGALRARMERILKTLGCKDVQLKLNKLCGGIEGKKKLKSRLYLEETPIREVAETVQSRIKIDRFTGGVMNTALYSAQPLWPCSDTQSRVELKAIISNCQPCEAGLLLLAVKDLWCGDLALGGEKSIGRGVLEGISLEIRFGGEQYLITAQSENKLKIDGDAARMEQWVTELQAQGGREE